MPSAESEARSRNDRQGAYCRKPRDELGGNSGEPVRRLLDVQTIDVLHMFPYAERAEPKRDVTAIIRPSEGWPCRISFVIDLRGVEVVVGS
jgi:hypothetical protein